MTQMRRLKSTQPCAARLPDGEGRRWSEGSTSSPRVAADYPPTTYNPARTPVHGNSPVWPATFAVAEWRGASGAAAMAAFILGWETQVRVARAAGPYHYEIGWHVTGAVGHFGAAGFGQNIQFFLEGGFALGCQIDRFFHYHDFTLDDSKLAGIIGDYPLAPCIYTHRPCQPLRGCVCSFPVSRNLIAKTESNAARALSARNFAIEIAPIIPERTFACKLLHRRE